MVSGPGSSGWSPAAARSSMAGEEVLCEKDEVRGEKTKNASAIPNNDLFTNPFRDAADAGVLVLTTASKSLSLCKWGMLLCSEGKKEHTALDPRRAKITPAS